VGAESRASGGTDWRTDGRADRQTGRHDEANSLTRVGRQSKTQLYNLMFF